MTRRELLDARMKRGAEDTNCYENREGCYEEDCFRRGYRSGSASLAPMLLKLAEGLEGSGCWCELRAEPMQCHRCEALAELDRFLEINGKS